MLYAVAIIFFILTSIVAAYYGVAEQQHQLWIVTTAVLGLVFIGLGYSQRPKPTTPTTTTAATTTAPIPPPPAPLTQPVTTEVVKEEKIELAGEAPPQPAGLTQLKGIKEKRAAQLKALGINTIEDLAKASAKDLATNLKISPKITGKWIENAKEIVEKS
jgi:predicted flap endonuclease-1-like 5' DNA nuclease